MEHPLKYETAQTKRADDIVLVVIGQGEFINEMKYTQIAYRVEIFEFLRGFVRLDTCQTHAEDEVHYHQRFDRFFQCFRLVHGELKVELDQLFNAPTSFLLYFIHTSSYFPTGRWLS